ncbi:MAG: Pr6Pr family membrane protein [Actinomycetes bacterium]
MRSISRFAFGVNSIVAWLGALGSLTIDAFGIVITPQETPTFFGGHPEGMAGALPRIIDNLSYFTIWSNIVVGITTYALYKNPSNNKNWLKVLRIASLMMITVTAIVYMLILAPDANPQSWNIYTNYLLHYITPPLTILVWLLFGPRKWFSWKNIGKALVIPILYVVYTFIRGYFINQYPYGFINAADLGYVGALTGTVFTLIFGLVVFIIYFAIDKILPGKRR